VTEQKEIRKRVLVTGATGFLGKFVVRELKTAGYEVSETSKSLGYDLRNEAEALTSFWLAKPEIVVHLAKAPGNSPETRAMSYRDTTMIDLNVVHSAALARAKLVTVVPPSVMSGISMLNGEAQAKSGLLSVVSHYEAQYGLQSRPVLLSELYGPFMRPQEGFLDVLTLINTFILAKFKACQYEGAVEWDGEDQSPFRPPVLEKGNAEAVLGVVPQMSLEHGLATMVAMRLESAGVKKSVEPD
jgi:nucleoside-diphosphate-sugar epimerase